MESDLNKLRIDKSHKARRDERSVWPWVIVVALLIGCATVFWQWRNASVGTLVQVTRVRVPEGAQAENDLVMLNATGYVMAAHKIELASKVVGRVAWVGVEMGDKIKKDQILVRLEDDEYRARLLQQEGQLESAQAMLSELK
ncbi:MAG TPA: biotin/lipoyl-binding protein, partial [Tepidisphaeraceae bacterium]|nr:biotin/lipoyl-binding protein [Tepidisphaeraceae bacterium]